MQMMPAISGRVVRGQFALNALDCTHAGVVFAVGGGRVTVLVRDTGTDARWPSWARLDA
jgi:hypothetical protein